MKCKGCVKCWLFAFLERTSLEYCTSLSKLPIFIKLTIIIGIKVATVVITFPFALRFLLASSIFSFLVEIAAGDFFIWSPFLKIPYFCFAFVDLCVTFTELNLFSFSFPIPLFSLTCSDFLDFFSSLLLSSVLVLFLFSPTDFIFVRGFSVLFILISEPVPFLTASEPW